MFGERARLLHLSGVCVADDERQATALARNHLATIRTTGVRQRRFQKRVGFHTFRHTYTFADRAHKNIFGIATIHCVARERRFVAEILHATTAIRAIAINATHPGNADTGSSRQFQGRAFDYFSHDLMARSQARAKRRKISFNDVKVSATHSAGDDPQ